MAEQDLLAVNLLGSTKSIGTQSTTQQYRSGQAIYEQGDNADVLFFIQRGHVKLTAMSNGGKKAIIAARGTSSARAGSPESRCALLLQPQFSFPTSRA